MANSSIYNRLFTIQKGGGKGIGGKGIGGKGIGKTGFRFDKMLDILFEKRQLLVMIFANLIVQLGITYYVFLHTNATQIKELNINTFFLIAGLFAILFIIALVPMPTWLKFILFCVFSYLQGFLLSSIKTEFNQKMVQTAIVGVLSIFVFMFTFGLGLIAFGVYLTNSVGLFLFWCLLCLILFSVVTMFIGTTSIMQQIFAFISLIIFSVYIIYDTNTILQRNYSGDFITASMDYYLDIINIFLDILRLNNNN